MSLLPDLVRRVRPKSTDVVPPRPLLGREARVSLLPPELRAAEGVRAIRRRLIGAVVGVAVLTAAGVTGSAALAVGSQLGLTLATQHTAELSRQIARYAAVGQLQKRVALTKTAVRVGSSTAIDWKSYLKRIDAVTPQAFTLTGVSLTSASVTAPFTQGTSPIDGLRAGTITMTATATSIDDLPAWLTGLSTLPGYADAAPNVTAGSTTGASYTVIVTMHITDGAYTTPITQGVAK